MTRQARCDAPGEPNGGTAGQGHAPQLDGSRLNDAPLKDDRTVRGNRRPGIAASGQLTHGALAGIGHRPEAGRSDRSLANTIVPSGELAGLKSSRASVVSWRRASLTGLNIQMSAFPDSVEVYSRRPSGIHARLSSSESSPASDATCRARDGWKRAPSTGFVPRPRAPRRAASLAGQASKQVIADGGRQRLHHTRRERDPPEPERRRRRFAGGNDHARSVGEPCHSIDRVQLLPGDDWVPPVFYTDDHQFPDARLMRARRPRRELPAIRRPGRTHLQKRHGRCAHGDDPRRFTVGPINEQSASPSASTWS